MVFLSNWVYTTYKLVENVTAYPLSILLYQILKLKTMEKMDQKKKTYYQLILDRSGSMADCIQPTVSGYNEQLQVLKSLEKRFPEQEIQVGLTMFNNEVNHNFSAVSPHSVNELTFQDFIPEGTTALYDAVGEAVLGLKTRIQHEIDAGIATVVVVILTDGHENASRIFNLSRISTLINELQNTEKWTFSYLGATLDAVKIAGEMRIKSENSLSFQKENMKTVFEDMDHSLIEYMQEKRSGKNPSNFLKKKD
jgi:hypothetical protein